LSEHTETYYEILFSDHHIFSIDDFKEIRKRFDKIGAQERMIITTEKDAVRLTKFNQSLAEYPFYVLPIQLHVLFGQEDAFTGLISNFITRFNKQKQEM
jgi:tetraacyldisaccharide 4'-kinase